MQPNIFLLSVLVNSYVVETSPHAANARSTAPACQHNCTQHTNTPERDQNHALNVIKTTNSTIKAASKRKQTTVVIGHVQRGHQIQVQTRKEQSSAVSRKKIPRKCRRNCRKNKHAKLNREIGLRKKNMQSPQPQRCHYNCSGNGRSKKDEMSKISRITPSNSSPRTQAGIKKLVNHKVSNHIRIKAKHLSNETIHKKNPKVNSKNKMNQTATSSNMFRKHAGKKGHVEQKRRFSIPVPLPLLLSKVASIASLFKNETSTRNIEEQHRGETSPNDASIHSTFNWGQLTHLHKTKGQNNVRSTNLGDRFSSFIPGVKKDVMTISQRRNDLKDEANAANIQPKEYSRHMNDVTINNIPSLDRSRILNDVKPMPGDVQPRGYTRNMKDVAIHTEGNTPPQSHSTNTNDEDKNLTSSIAAVKKDAMAEVGAISEADVSSLFMNPLHALHSAFSRIATKALPRTLKMIGDIADVLKSISKQEPNGILKRANLLYRREWIPKHAKTSQRGKIALNLQKKVP